MKGVKRWLFATDSHGRHIDPAARAAFLDFKKQWKPHITIHGGDWLDLTALRRGASEEEANEGVKDDIEAGIDFVREGEFSVLCWGNHCQRIIRQMRVGHGRLREYATMLYNAMMDRIGPNVHHVPYGKRKGVYQLGNLKILHGYCAGQFAARQTAQAYNSSTLIGHIHSASVFDLPTYDRITGYSSGCLCDLDLEYTESQLGTLRWSHGFAYGLLLPNGETVVWLAKKVGGQWWLPSEVRAIA